jgi:hypothetical protein
MSPLSSSILHLRAFSEIVHEDVVAFPRSLPKIEDLTRRRHIGFRSLPSEVGVDERPPRSPAIIAIQVETNLVVVDPDCARRQFALDHELLLSTDRRLSKSEAKA